MKPAYFKLLGFYLVSAVALAGELPTGFEAPGLITALKGKKIVIESPVSTPTELIQVSKAFFKGVSVDNYLQLATDHKKYALMFKGGSPRIENAATTSVNSTKTEFEYSLLVEVDGPFGSVLEVTATGKQVVAKGAEMMAESTIDNQLTNHKDKLILANESTRVIPFEDGFLLLHQLHIVLKQQTTASAALKKQLGILFARFPDAFRKELGG